MAAAELRRAARALVAAGLLGLTACGAAASAPTLEGLRLTPAGPYAAGQTIALGAGFADEDCDVQGGQTDVALKRRDEARGAVYTAPVEGEACAGELEVALSFPAGARPGRYELGLTLIDASGRRSPSLLTELELLP